MDFLHRDAPNQPRTRAAAANTQQSQVAAGSTNGTNAAPERFSMFHQPRWLRVASVVLLFSVTALVVAVVLLLNRGSFTREANIVDKDRYQAVFLSTDQVYFGRIIELNNKYINLSDVYYLSAQKSDDQKETNLELVKLGCEVHGPQDQLVVNRDQVTFWENIKDDSTVVKGIKQLQEKNKNGLVCESQTAANETTQQSPQQAVGGNEDTQNKQQ